MQTAKKLGKQYLSTISVIKNLQNIAQFEDYTHNVLDTKLLCGLLAFHQANLQEVNTNETFYSRMHLEIFPPKNTIVYYYDRMKVIFLY